MIINSIRAENVLKYSVLELEDIPEKGLISVTGDNESGKSSIGESICFALFGRTFSLGPDELDKVIRWGESRCSIRLEFTTPDGSRYQIARFLDKQGNHGASISLAGGDPLVRGPDEVEAKLRTIIGFGYIEFIESFYLAQREISTPNPHSFAVKAMAGVDAMEQTIVSCRAEQEGFNDQLAETRVESAGVDAKLEALNLVQGYLEALEAEQQALIDGIEDSHQRIRLLGERSLLGKKTGDRLLRGAKNWVAANAGLSYNDYQAQASSLVKLLAGIDSSWRKDPHTTKPIDELLKFAAQTRRPLEMFDTLREMAAGHRRDLKRKLGDPGSGALLAAGPDAAVHAEADAGPGEDRGAAAETLILQHQQLLQGETELQSDRRHWRIIMAICLLASMALGGWFLTLPPADPVTAVGDGQLPSMLKSWLPIGATVFGIFAISGWWYARRLTGRVDANQAEQAQILSDQTMVRDRIERLAGLDSMPLPEAVELLQQADSPEIADQLTQFVGGPGLALLDQEERKKQQLLLRERVIAVTEGLVGSWEDANAETQALDIAIAEDGEKREALKKDIEVEQERVRKHLELTAVATNLSNRSDDLEHRIRVRDLSIELLEGAILYISQRFNTEVRNLSADSLPKFTNGRYEHLQIDENLNVKAFSNEKRDFMQLDEISSGTQRQIMLAVRMSLSQKLVNSVIQGPQVIFLDEPFAFFDEDRTASSLAVLPEVSGDFTQIWVTSQKFPERSHFDIHIECNAKESISPWIRSADGREAQGQ